MLSEKPWRPDRVLRLIAGFYSAMFLAGIAALGYKEAFPDAVTNQLVVFAVGTFTFQGVTLVLIHIFLRQHQTTWAEGFGFKEPRLARTIFLGALVSILILPVALSLADFSSRLIRTTTGVTPELQPSVQVVREATSIVQLVVQALAAVVFAPIVEELIFRGVLYPAVKRTYNQKVALWGVSILFAMTHMNFTVILPLTVLAIILTFLYETTRNLIAPIVAHSLFNAANFAYLVYQRYQQGVL
jgi:membrane protease YdiL (CAAX protease family)